MSECESEHLSDRVWNFCQKPEFWFACMHDTYSLKEQTGMEDPANIKAEMKQRGVLDFMQFARVNDNNNNNNNSLFLQIS